MRSPSWLALLPLLAIVGCGPSESGAATASSPAAPAASTPASAPSDPPSTAPVTSSPGPVTSSPAPDQPGTGTVAAAPKFEALLGLWQGPRNAGESTPYIWIHQNRIIQLEFDGTTCMGRASRVGNKYQLNFSRCALPMPPSTVTLSADGRTMTLVAGGKRETWKLMQRPR